MSIDYLEVLKVFGLPVALLLYYIWMEHTDKQLRIIRENELIRRVETLEVAHRETLTATVNKVTEALTNNTAVMSRFCRALEAHKDLTDVAKELMHES